MSARHLAPYLEESVACGLLPRDIALEFDEWADKLAARVVAGELTRNEWHELVKDRALRDVARAILRGFPQAKL